MPHLLRIPHGPLSPMKEIPGTGEKAYPAFSVPQLPSPSPLCGDCPSLVQSPSFPFCRISSSLARSLGWKLPVASMSQGKSLPPSFMEPAVSGGPRACWRWSTECLLTMLLGIVILWRDCSPPTGYCYQGAS